VNRKGAWKNKETPEEERLERINEAHVDGVWTKTLARQSRRKSEWNGREWSKVKEEQGSSSDAPELPRVKSRK
jgi:hypothetical protein